MSVLDIFPVDPDYPVAVDVLDGVLRQQAQDGRQFARALRADRRQFRLEFRSRSTDELNEILAWQRRMRDQVFLFEHKVWERGSWNLLGFDAEAEVSNTNVVVKEYTIDGTEKHFALRHLGLEVGEVLSMSADFKTSVVDGAGIWLLIRFFDADQVYLGVEFLTPSETGDAYVRQVNENFVIPANTVYLKVAAVSDGGETFFVKNVKVNRGATAEDFEVPFTNEEYVPRFFPVRFAGPVNHRLLAHESHDIEVDLIEAVGATLAELHWPDPLDLSTQNSFLEQTEGAALVGVWTDAEHNDAHDLRGEVTNPNTNSVDEFAFTYSGYGFRLWARNDPALGVCKVLLDDVDLGNVDLGGATADSAPLLTKLDVPLGLHTVKIRATGDTNLIVADAIEVMT